MKLESVVAFLLGGWASTSLAMVQPAAASDSGLKLREAFHPPVQPPRKRSTPSQCNGYKELCDRQFNLVAYPTTHNSYAFGDNIAANQNKNITDQLDDGIRGFMLDLHNPSSTSLSLRASSEPYLCHTTCLLLNDGPLSQTLQYFTTFLEANENEVITIFFENDDKFSATTIAQSFKDVGLDKYAFVPSGSSSNGNYTWPTLAEMIADNKRLVVMVDGESNTAAVPWILYDRDYTVQTPYTVGVGSTFDCTPMTQARPLVVMNHFVYTNYTVLNSVVEKPSPDTASTVNTRQSIVGQANLCGSAARFPNFVTVDFYDVGDLFKAVADINKVQYSSSSTTLDTFSGGVPSSSYTSTASQSTLSLAAPAVATAVAAVAAVLAFLM